MSDDPGAIDNGWDALPGYTDKPGDGDDAVTVSISTTPGEWLVNTTDAVVVPMSMIEVVEALRSQKLNERSLVWRAGMQEWAPVERVPQLKLAARLPSVLPPPSSGPMRPTNTTKPPPKPARTASSAAQSVVTLPPPRSATAHSTPAPASAVTRTPLPPPPNMSPRAPAATALPSRKATLPFGLPSPLAIGSKPLQSRPTPRPALPPPGPEDTGVLAVYDRPAATISFDLAPEVPVRTYSAPAALLPQTLAPTTTDSAPQRAPLPPPRNADLSVVAARDFRQAQQFSKRLIVASSIGSALVASLLTLWLSRGATRPSAAAPPAPVQTLAPAAPAPPPVVTPPPAAPEPVAVVEAPSPEPSAKPKAKRKARAWKPPAKTAPTAVTSEEPAVAEPKAEPNPYDVKLEDESAQPPSSSQGLDLEKVLREEAAPSL